MNRARRAARGFFIFSLFVMGLEFSSPAKAESFDAWLRGLRNDAVKDGISQRMVGEALPYTLKPDDRVMRLDQAQPEGGAISFKKYKNRIVSSSRLREGKYKILEYSDLLRKIGHIYGVPPQYIAALWGIETSYGRYSGNFSTIRSLVTLAYEANRHAFFRTQLLDALHIVDHGDVSLRKMKGSWAGAMGQCQFMPSSYEKYAQDYNKDRKRDIWHNEADVFASTAAYLADNGWRKNEPWGVRVFPPKGFNNKLIGMNVNEPVEFWRRRGLRVPAVFAPGEILSVVQPGGRGYKAYAVGTNYRILLNWNKSTYFATAAGLLADGLKS
ncbi:MAG: lytic murein transglycosylase [Alphaproteobacteria bacterium]|nr:lytic murein transglycosylase [Alphaproteobacteria bacterium]MDE2336979.1 lytic murein transglycosylase [Alphaproteobacteria bacterium]